MNTQNPLPPLPLINGALWLDASGWIENLTTCMRKTQYSQLNQRRKVDAETALNFGTAIHIAMELRYQRYGTGPVDDNYFTDLGGLLQRHYAANPPPMDDWRNQNWAMEIAHKYIEAHPTEDFECLLYDEPQVCHMCQGSGTLFEETPGHPNEGAGEDCPICSGTGHIKRMIEIPFAVPLFTWVGCLPKGSVTDINSVQWYACETTEPKAHIPIMYCGRIDLPTSHHGKIMIMDHKTSSIMGATTFDNLNQSDQQKGYCYAFEQATGKKVHGYMPNVIRSKEPPQYVTNGTTRGGKSQSPKAWWEESFQRDYHYLCDGELEEWKHNTIEMVNTFFFHYSRGYMPMERTACTRYGRCPFFDVCTTYPPEQRGMILASELYKDNTWSPIKH